MKKAGGAAALAALLMLAGCGAGSKKSIVDATRNVKTKAELKKALGEPDRFNKLGPMETWTYKARDGEVSFVVIGDQVTVKAAVGESEKP